MHTRQCALNQWLIDWFHNTSFTLLPLAGDASFRRYYRIQTQDQTYVAMDAPPEKESTDSFVNVAQILLEGGIHAPKIFAVNRSEGFILLEDLGDRLFSQALTPSTADSLYEAALITLQRIQQCPTNNPQLPQFDKSHMLQEMSLFPQWFVTAYLNMSLTEGEEKLIQVVFHQLSEEISQQPQVFIHRDYHSRNLLVVEDTALIDLGVIDFQDAMQGPFAYDLVSLLKDCYIEWPQEKINHWVRFFYQTLPNKYGWSIDEFNYAFDLCGLQRHLKVLGIFCRLHLRDQKTAYLQDLPRTFNYVMACLERYPQYQNFHELMMKIYVHFKEMHE